MTKPVSKDAVKSSSPARAPLKLSREMKLVLALLLLLALLGAWFVWTGSRGADDLSQTPPATPAGDPPAQSAADSATEGATPPEETGSADGGAVAVQPGGQVEVPTIPAFRTLEGEDAAGPATEALPTPGGINPDTALAALPGVNPFRPLALAPNGEAPAPTPAAPVAEAPISAPATSLDLPLDGPVATSDLSGSSGALALAPLPGTTDPVPLETPRVTGAFPLPILPGANVPAPTALTVTRPAAQAGADQPPVVRIPPPRPVTPTRPPARPPVAGVSVPRQNIDLSGALARQAARPGSEANPAAGAAAPALTALPTPGTPQPITQLGDDRTPTPANALEALIQSRDLGLNAAVLGPVNTAILHSKDGFLVVSVGQTLPDSRVLVQGVTADSVTLALGTDTTTLHLDDSANDPANDPTQGEP